MEEIAKKIQENLIWQEEFRPIIGQSFEAGEQRIRDVVCGALLYQDIPEDFSISIQYGAGKGDSQPFSVKIEALPERKKLAERIKTLFAQPDVGWAGDEQPYADMAALLSRVLFEVLTLK